MDFSLYHSVHAGSGVHLASYPRGTRALSLRVEQQQEHGPGHSPPSKAKVKNACDYSSTSPYVFMTPGNFTFHSTTI